MVKHQFPVWSVRAFERLKQVLAEKTQLVHSELGKPIILETDVSQYRIRTVILDTLPVGSEEDIVYGVLSKATPKWRKKRNLLWTSMDTAVDEHLLSLFCRSP